MITAGQLYEAMVDWNGMSIAQQANQPGGMCEYIADRINEGSVPPAEYALTPESPWTPTSDPETLARRFHDAYERLAPSFGYQTREASAKPWAQVPENNRRLMIAVCAEIAAQPAEDTAPVLAGLREEMLPLTTKPWIKGGACIALVEAAQQRLTGPGEEER